MKTAYLYSNLNNKIYMEQPEGFKLPSKEKKSSNSTKHCMALSKLAYLGGKL